MIIQKYSDIILKLKEKISEYVLNIIHNCNNPEVLNKYTFENKNITITTQHNEYDHSRIVIQIMKTTLFVEREEFEYEEITMDIDYYQNKSGIYSFDVSITAFTEDEAIIDSDTIISAGVSNDDNIYDGEYILSEYDDGYETFLHLIENKKNGLSQIALCKL